MLRLRIALLSVIISGAVLVCFGIFFLNTVNQVRIDRIDREIQTLGESQLYDWHPRKNLQRFEQSLRSIYGQDRWKDLIVHITDADYLVLYKSPHWPQEIRTTFFPGFDGKMEMFPGVYGGRPPHQNTEIESRADNGPADMPRPDRHLNIQRPLHPNQEGQGWPPPPQNPPPSARIKKSVFRTLETSSGTWRTAIMGSQHITIMLGMNMSSFNEDTGRYKRTFMVAVPLALLLLAVGGWLVAHRAIKPVADITRIAKNINARGLNQRIITTNANNELSQLVRVINDMLDRLEKSFSQAVRFSADAAHELQTPLTILQGSLDDALQHARFGSDEQKRCGMLLEEVSHLKNIVRKLLILAQADSGKLPLTFSPVNMSDMTASAAEDAEAIGPHLKIETHILPGVILQGDPDLLRMLIQGISTNAVKYNIDKGLIRFVLTIEKNNALLSITNTGPMIPDEARQLIFDRFYRMDKSRNQRVPGAGLGLSLGREIANAHKGELRLEPAEKNLNTFSLSIPLLS